MPAWIFLAENNSVKIVVSANKEFLVEMLIYKIAR